MKKKYSEEIKRLSNCKEGYLRINRRSKLGKQLYKETGFINFDAKTKERLLYVKYDLYEQVKCPTCGGPSKIDLRSDKFRIKFCSYSCRSNYVYDGMSMAKRNAIKSVNTMRKRDNEDGNGYIKRTIITRKTLSEVNPKTGLTRAKEIGKKSKETLSKINPNTGLTGFEERGLKVKGTLSKINPKTGLTRYQEIGKKASNTLRSIDPKTNTSIAKERNDKRVKTINTKRKNGVLIKDLMKMSEIDTKSKFNIETGLTKYQEIALKIKETKTKINPETGLSKYQEIGIEKRKQNFVKFQQQFNIFFDSYILLTTLEEYLSNINTKNIRYQHSCGEIRESLFPSVRCLKCYPYNRSIAENEILEYCNSFTDNVISNDRQLIKPMELDIVLPDYNLAIEYDGLFWHSSYSIESEESKYHLMKTQKCMENGYQLFHIFENEWEDPIKKDIWKSIISNKLGQSNRIHARKCEICNVDNKEIKTFLESNHLQGYVPSSINIGLFYQDELVSLMTFSKSRYGKKYDWELLRFCNKKYTSVIGGASRLFKDFAKSNSGIVVSYADMRRSAGNLYDKLGFELSHISEPNYWYWNKKNGLVLESRIKYQKHKLSGILEEYDVKLTESENMYKNGFRKIYDCGNMVYHHKL